MQNLINLLTKHGFVPENQEKDFGMNIKYVYYCSRYHMSKYEYISLVSYDGKFLEAIYEHYLAPKNNKKKLKLKNEKEIIESQKLGLIAYRATLLRNEKEIIEKIS